MTLRGKLTALAASAGLIYNSWLLGYWLNPAVAKTGLASEFEALHQPYSWLFIACDVVCSLMVLVLCWQLWQHTRRTAEPGREKAFAVTLYGLVIFSVGTIIDALLPMSCEPSLQRCPTFRQDHMLLLHGIFSISAALALFVSLVLIWWYERRSWLLNLLMTGYILFGLFSLMDAIRPTHHNWSQHYYLLLCGLWLASVPYAACRLITDHSRSRRRKPV
jgi:hypothetical protein